MLNVFHWSAESSSSSRSQVGAKIRPSLRLPFFGERKKIQVQVIEIEMW